MQVAKPFTTEIKARGQLTMPKKIRQMGHLDEGQTVSLVPVGGVVIIMPRTSELDEARRRIAKKIKKSGVSANEVLEGLAGERELLFKERYTKKSRRKRY